MILTSPRLNCYDKRSRRRASPLPKKREMLTALRVIVLAHSKGTLKLQTNLGAILAICPAIKSLVSSQIGNSLAQFKTDLTLEFSLT